MPFFICLALTLWGVEFPRLGIVCKFLAKERYFMLGAQIGESKGKRIVRRILSTDPPTAEVTFEDSGTMAGVATNGSGTYTSVIRPDGDAITWTGTGLGKFGAVGAVSYRGMLFYQTASQKLASLNNSCGAFEFE